jgi:ATP-dependent DNA helicase RecG
VDEAAVRRLIADGESSTVEFKIKAPRPAELAERMCGMANSRTGGVIIFGVADIGGQIVGLKDPNQSIDLALRAARMVKPPITFAGAGPAVHTLDGHIVVVAEIPPNDGMLYQSSGVFWIRRGSHTVPMSSDEVSAHLHNSGAIRWERGVHSRATLDDIDRDRVERYLALRAERHIDLRYTSWEELLLGLQCAAREPKSGVVRPTNVGLLMFGRDPQWFIPQSEVVCIRYADRLGVRKYVNRLNITGTLPELIDKAAEFLKLYVQVGAEIVEFKRIDMPEYPLEALREAVVNAVVHRDYSLEGETIRIFFYTDRVEIHSPGLLPPGVTLTDLVQMRAPSRPRNVLLAEFMRDLPGYMERVGAGIRFMVNEMRELDLPDPEFREQHEFLVIFRNGHLVSPDVASTLSPRQLIGLQLIQEQGSITSSQYCEVTGASERTALRELRDLMEREIIVVRGRTRSARYYLP